MDQTQELNYLLHLVSNKIREKNDNLVTMSDKYNKENEYTYLNIPLIEMLPIEESIKPFSYQNKMFANFCPQYILIKCLIGNVDHNNIMTNYRDLILYQTNNIDLFNMVTPNLDKSIWYLEKELKTRRFLKLYCKMNLINMTDMLKYCPIPNICLSSCQFNISDPQEFVDIINNLDSNQKKCLDFIPYLRKLSQKTVIENAVYYLYGNITIVDKNCSYNL